MPRKQHACGPRAGESHGPPGMRAGRPKASRARRASRASRGSQPRRARSAPARSPFPLCEAKERIQEVSSPAETLERRRTEPGMVESAADVHGGA